LGVAAGSLGTFNPKCFTEKGTHMNNNRFNSRMLIAMSATAIAVAGCADMNLGNLSQTQKGTAVGAGVGALAGAAIGGDTRGAVVGGLLGAAGGYVWSKHMQDKKMAMERATMGSGVQVSQTPDNQLKLNIPSDLSFDTGRADIKPNMRPILDQFASGLSNQPNTEIRIIGHTDNTGSDAVNDPLSVQRAQAARQYLAARGVDPNRIVIAGRGEREPIADNRTDAGRAQNRRVEIFLGEKANVAAR
jgi:outer membrane protein OmpA-like peptidoglycan-associated protein